MPKPNPHAFKVVAKLRVAPKALLKAFGEGFRAYRHGEFGTREWDFTDCNMDKFLVYDWKATQEFGGQPIPGYDYVNQIHLRPKNRKRIYPTEMDFWNSDEKFDFFVNCSEYGEFRKFKYWFYREVSLAAEEEKSFEEKAFEKYGSMDSMDTYGKKYAKQTEFAVHKYNQTFFSGEKYEFKEWDKPVSRKAKPGEECRILERD